MRISDLALPEEFPKTVTLLNIFEKAGDRLDDKIVFWKADDLIIGTSPKSYYKAGAMLPTLIDSCAKY